MFLTKHVETEIRCNRWSDRMQMTDQVECIPDDIHELEARAYGYPVRTVSTELLDQYLPGVQQRMDHQ